MLESDRATLKARETRIAELEAQIEDYRRQLALVICRAVAQNRALAERKPLPALRAKNKRLAKRRPNPKKPRRPPKSRRFYRYAQGANCLYLGARDPA
jgi:23S rRNA maturation mini-RNase III